MMERDFERYLRDEKKMGEKTIKSRISNCKRVEIFEGSLDLHFDNDQCQTLLARLTYSTNDQDRKRQPRHKIPIDGNVRTGTATLKQAVTLYLQFRRASVTK